MGMKNGTSTLENSMVLCHQDKSYTSVQLFSHVRLFVTPRIAALQASLSITNSQSSLRFTSIESVMPSSHLILCRPLLLLPTIPPSIRVFPNESNSSHEVAEVLEFQLQHHSLQRNPTGLISFRMDWLDLLTPLRNIYSTENMFTQKLVCESL